MVQRIAVLLAVASILVIVCAAQGPSMEASAQKYDKKSHNKHEHEKYDKPDKHEKEYKPDSYKPDSYKPDSYKPDGYRPDSYKPDGHKPDGYKPDGYKADEYKHKHHKSPRGEYKEHYGNPGYNGYNGYEHEYDNYGPGNNYGPDGYDYNTPDGTPGNTPHMYDSGYYGGNGGRHTIRLDVLLPENLLNTTALDADTQAPVTSPCNNRNAEGCVVDYGLICCLRRSNPYGSYVPEKSYEEKFGPVIQSIVRPLLIGRGTADRYINWRTLNTAFSSNPGALPVADNGGLNVAPNGLVIVNGDQKAYIVSEISGAMSFAPDSEDCHPILNGDSTVTFTNVPVYVMITKIALPADPSAYIGLNTPRQVVSIQSADEKTSKKSGDSDVQTTLCGLALVARGPVKVSTKVGTTTITYSGTMEYVKSWTDGTTTVPRLDEEVEASARGAAPAFLDTKAKRLDAVCKTNDVPFAHVGSLRLDVVRDPTP